MNTSISFRTATQGVFHDIDADELRVYTGRSFDGMMEDHSDQLEKTYTIHIIDISFDKPKHDLEDSIHQWVVNTYAPDKDEYFYSLSSIVGHSYHYSYGRKLHYHDVSSQYITIAVRTQANESFDASPLIQFLIDNGCKLTF